jgi:hypothetical protein
MAKVCKEVSSIINTFSLSLQEIVRGAGHSQPRPSSASVVENDLTKPVLHFQLPATLSMNAHGNVEWNIPAGVSKVGHAMKNAEFVRAWKGNLDSMLSANETFASSKISDEGPETLLSFWEGELSYWGEHFALLRSTPYRAVLLTCRADRSLNRQWKNAISSLSHRFARAHDSTKFLKMLSSLFSKLHVRCPLDVAPAVLSQIVDGAHASYSICRYGESTQILTTFFARISNRLIELCKYVLGSEQFWKIFRENAQGTNSTLRSCLSLLEGYPCMFKQAQEESAAAYAHQPAPTVDRSVVFARTKLFSDRLKKLLDVTDASVQFDNAIATGIDGLSTAVDAFKDQLKLFASRVNDPLNLSGKGARRRK